jgi:hypothetical protein
MEAVLGVLGRASQLAAFALAKNPRSELNNHAKYQRWRIGRRGV